MDVFLAKIEQLLAVLGQNFLRPIAKTATTPKAALLFCAIKTVKATGRLSENAFLDWQVPATANIPPRDLPLDLNLPEPPLPQPFR